MNMRFKYMMLLGLVLSISLLAYTRIDERGRGNVSAAPKTKGVKPSADLIFPSILIY